MSPKVHANVMLVAQLVLYALIFLIIVFLFKDGDLKREYVLGSFIGLLVLVPIISGLIKQWIRADCPQCGSPCKTTGRSPVYYKCTSCDFSRKSNLFEDGDDQLLMR